MNGEEVKASSEEERAADRRRAIRLWALAGLLTSSLTLLAFLA